MGVFLDCRPEGELAAPLAHIASSGGEPEVATVAADPAGVVGDEVGGVGLQSGLGEGNPQPPPPPRSAAETRLPRAAGPDARLDLPGGVIAFYSSNQTFTAACTNPMHHPCVLSRKRTVKAHMRGRPLALMYAWLEQGALWETKEEHWATIPELADDAATLRVARVALSEDPDARDLVNFERPLGPSEADP